MEHIYRGHIFRILIGIVALLLLLTGSTNADPEPMVSVTPSVCPSGCDYYIWDESSGSPLPFTWNSTNLAGFNIDGIGTENLTVLQTDLKSIQRIINFNNLTYSTTALPRKLNVVTALNLTDYITMINKGLERAYPGQAFENGQYHVVNWGGQKYIALNGKVDKLAKLVMEQGLTEKKSLRMGETWDIGGGWGLTANSIDARASPRQVWLTLSKDGVKKDDKVLSSGSPDARPIYTYVEKSIGGETDVPLFVTYVDSIFAGTTSDIVELRYTWALSASVTTINPYIAYGIFRYEAVTGRTLSLRNSNASMTLAPNATVDLIGHIKFKVIDNSTYLKFYPTDEPKFNVTASTSSVPVGIPKNVLFTVTVDGSPVNGAIVNVYGAATGGGITDSNGKVEININAAYDGMIIVDSGKAGYTNGTTSLHSYSVPIAAMGSWRLEENYVLNLTDIDT
ncbi:MAG: S-layer protein domain-containing protein, partial [Candidatus Methanoperedens sp.]|nr:S-layer protein domain-containing protein [Candidatus Methanoperedens sp.]